MNANGEGQEAAAEEKEHDREFIVKNDHEDEAVDRKDVSFVPFDVPHSEGLPDIEEMSDYSMNVSCSDYSRLSTSHDDDSMVRSNTSVKLLSGKSVVVLGECRRLNFICNIIVES